MFSRESSSLPRLRVSTDLHALHSDGNNIMQLDSALLFPVNIEMMLFQLIFINLKIFLIDHCYYAHVQT